MVVFCGLPGPQDKNDSARRIWISLGARPNSSGAKSRELGLGLETLAARGGRTSLELSLVIMTF